ncbi:MAG: DUF2147 domain-containing protein [Pseudomonadota bacterium]
MKLHYLAVVALVAATTASADNVRVEDLGVWKNKSNSVHVEVTECGDARCGTVVWASEKAKGDARKGGTEQLVGTQLLRKFREKDNSRWRGKAFVPDMNKEFTGTITPIDFNTLEVKGCIIGGLICKTQVWTRVS